MSDQTKSVVNRAKSLESCSTTFNAGGYIRIQQLDSNIYPFEQLTDMERINLANKIEEVVKPYRQINLLRALELHKISVQSEFEEVILEIRQKENKQ